MVFTNYDMSSMVARMGFVINLSREKEKVEHHFIVTLYKYAFKGVS